MKKNLINLLYFAMIAMTVTLVGCGDDDDNGGGTNPTDPCENVTCPCYQECVEGTCTDLGINKSGQLSGNETWTKDNIYYLLDKVVVPNGVTLTIEPGTIIKGNEGAGTLATALVVARGGKLIAEGTAADPIIFTSCLDNIQVGEKQGSNLTDADNAKWGGVIVLGYATISAENGDTEAQIEGIPASESYGTYGGNDDADNSGIIKYVSIRHGGAEIGAGNDINGLTLGGVGTGTVVDQVEILANFDDGIECFGGSVNVTNSVVVNQGDDALDIDQNYSGTFTNFIVIMNSDSDEGLEIDGPEGSTHTDGKFEMINGTVRTTDGGGGGGADLKSKAQGALKMITFEGFAKTPIKFRESFVEADCSDKTDAYDRLLSGDLFLSLCDIVSSDITEMATVYTKVSACESNITQATIDAANMELTNAGTSIVTSTSKGADTSVFGWTWAAMNNKF